MSERSRVGPHALACAVAQTVRPPACEVERGLLCRLYGDVVGQVNELVDVVVPYGLVSDRVTLTGYPGEHAPLKVLVVDVFPVLADHNVSVFP